ncbi:MAG: hypothetical protein PUE72_12690 [Lachnospiraceae bacterium]|nr:hypothetical protein [Lachnospiraceae bacterium]
MSLQAAKRIANVCFTADKHSLCICHGSVEHCVETKIKEDRSTRKRGIQ